MENSNSSMKISFKSDEDAQHCYETNGSNVAVNVEPRSSKSRGSSMVKLKSIVGYKWKLKNYPGRLISQDRDGKIVAYSISVEGKSMIRAIHIESNKRTLLKGLVTIQDLQFCESSKQIMLAAIDELSLFVFKLTISDSNDLSNELLLKINHQFEDHTPFCDKINWCPYIPESEKSVDEFSPLLLVWVRSNRFECYSVKAILDNYSVGEFDLSNIEQGVIKSYEDDRAMISNASFSPDGTTLAISTTDGFVKFYQIYFHETVPRCLHNWNPTKGRNVSSFFFLDNLTQTSGSAFWEYMVVLYDDNTELALYHCESWKQLQRITFKSVIGEKLEFKAEIDKTSSYVILSDMINRQMYVLQILKENALSHQQNGEKHQNGNDAKKNVSRVYIKSIAEFNLASSTLSYVISNASVKRNKCPFSDNFLIDDGEEYDEENNSVFCVALKLFMVIPEGVQECHILYQPALGETVESSPESPIIAEVKTEIIQQTTQKTAISLLTPEAFSSPIEKPKDVAPDVFSALYMLSKTTPGAANKSHENVVNLTNCTLIESEKIFQQKNAAEQAAIMKSCAASGGSSPSREVRDILLKADSVNEDYYPGEDSDEMEIEAEQKKEVLDALKSLDVDFNNIVVDEDDEEDEENEEISTEDDETDAKAKKTQEWPPAPQFIDASVGHATSKEVEILSKRMNQMIEIMETQSNYIAELRGEIYKVLNGVKINNENLSKVEENCKLSVEKSSNKIEGQLLLQEMFMRDLNEGMSQMFQTQMRNQSSCIEKSVAESVLKLTTNKVFIENMSRMIVAGMQKTIEQTFKKSLEEMIPSYEKISHEMLREVGKAFSIGTKDYTRAFDAHMKQYGAVQVQLNEFTNAISAIPTRTEEQIRLTFGAMVGKHQFELKNKMEKSEEKILSEVRELVKSEIQRGFERQTVNLEESVLSVVQRSHTETPAPTIHDPKDLIRQFLRCGEINTAFHQTLVTSDLTLLDFTIENAEFSKVFDPCPLEQSVLLSLIQQLTADMNKFNELKLKYLSSAVISLNKNDPIIREHAPKILHELYSTLTTFRQMNPTSSLISNITIVMFLAQSVMKGGD